MIMPFQNSRVDLFKMHNNFLCEITQYTYEQWVHERVITGIR